MNKHNLYMEAIRKSNMVQKQEIQAHLRHMEAYCQNADLLVQEVLETACPKKVKKVAESIKRIRKQHHAL
jgi:hypothetical protein